MKLSREKLKQLVIEELSEMSFSVKEGGVTSAVTHAQDVTCDVCKGSGETLDPNKKRGCTHCRGLGYQEGYFAGSYNQPEECIFCKGTGLGTKECEKCHGAGKVQKLFDTTPAKTIDKNKLPLKPWDKGYVAPQKRVPAPVQFESKKLTHDKLKQIVKEELQQIVKEQKASK